MAENTLFARGGKLPSYFVNRIQDILSAAKTEFRLERTGTSVRVRPVEPLGLAAISLEGRWRFITATTTRPHPGGAAGTYDIWAVAVDTDVDDIPDPFTDHTDYAFTLRITPTGVDPSGAGVEVFEKVGELDWDGAAITALRQEFGSVYGALLEDDAIEGSGAITVTRQPDGSVLLDLADGSIDLAKLTNAAPGQFAVADAGGEFAAVDLGGDVHMDEDGVARIVMELTQKLATGDTPSLNVFTHAWEDVPGCDYVTAVAGFYIVHASFLFKIVINAGGTGPLVHGGLNVDGAVQTARAVYQKAGAVAGDSDLSITVSQTWIIATGSGKHVKLQASMPAGAGATTGVKALATHTQMTLLRVAA